MVHPFIYYEDDTAIEAMKQITVTLEICTFYNGIPHGIAIIQYTDPDDDYLSFVGLGVFNHGQLHNAPFTWVHRNGYGSSFSKMQNGRPADGSYVSGFHPNGSKQNVDSLEEETDVSGW